MNIPLIRAFLHLLPIGFEVHPNRIIDIVHRIEPEIETKQLSKQEIYQIKQKFKDLVSMSETVTVWGEYYD